MPPKPMSPTPTDEEKAKKAAEKAKRKAEFEAKRSVEMKKENAGVSSIQTGPSGSKGSKADLRRQRREQQESQRDSKAKDQEQKKQQSQPHPLKEETMKPSVSKGKENLAPKPALPTKTPPQKMVKEVPGRSPRPDHAQVFPEIPTRHQDIDSLTRELGVRGVVLHPSIIKLGVKLNQFVIKGSTPRSLAVMVALKEMIQDYSTPPGKALDRDMPALIDSSMVFLGKCRPITTGMMNAAGFIKRNIERIALEDGKQASTSSSCLRRPHKSEEEIKKLLDKTIDGYIEDEIACALKSIIEEGSSLIKEGEVILTLGYSLKMQHILNRAVDSGKKFSVVVVDCGPDYDGIQMLRFLKNISSADNVRVSYIFISAISHVMSHVSKVLIGGHGVLANGFVVSKMGSSQIALVADSYNVPFIVCCETSEFTDAVHTDAFVYNEAGLCEDYFQVKNNEKLGKFITDFYKSSSSDGDNTKKKKRITCPIKVLSLVFDVTPPEYVSMIVTEKGIIPCSAVSAVIRRNFIKLS